MQYRTHPREGHISWWLFSHRNCWCWNCCIFIPSLLWRCWFSNRCSIYCNSRCKFSLKRPSS